MKFLSVILFLAILSSILPACNGQTTNSTKQTTDKDSVPTKNTVTYLRMNLSAYGVESDDFPNAEAEIDFINNTSTIKKSYFNPKYKDSTYSLTKQEIDTIRALLQSSDLSKLRKKYDDHSKSDQPNSIISITTNKTTFGIDDYGLVAEYPINQLYRIVYKLQ